MVGVSAFLKRCQRCQRLLPLARFYEATEATYGGRRRCCVACRKDKQRLAALSCTRSPNEHLARGTKVCTQCKKELPASSFSRHSGKPDGRMSYCKPCGSVMLQSSKYRLSKEEVLACRSVPCCQACGEALPSESHCKFDHCHEGMHFRGVLCHKCNIAAAGPAAQCVRRLRGLIVYLERDLERQDLCQD